MNRKLFFLYLFFTVSLLELMALVFQFEAIHVGSKPLIVLSLLGYYLSSVAVRSGVFLRALFFSWAGDVLLLLTAKDETFFIAGLLAFLISHLLFIRSYREHQEPETGKGLLGTQKVRYSLPIILAGSGLVVILFPTLGSLRIPVLLYAIVLMVMVMMALFRFGRTSAPSFWRVFGGALLFMTSDSILALNKFYHPFTAAGVYIMFFYIAAQYLIVTGIIQHGVKK